MHLRNLVVRDFRNLRRAQLELADGLTVAFGANGAGKTNLIEALYFGLTAQSFRATQDRQLLRFGAGAAWVCAHTVDENGSAHRIEVGLGTDDRKQITVDGTRCDRVKAFEVRPAVSVFYPDRLELLKGRPALRRAHLDHFAAALWPAQRQARAAYHGALSQRNALLGRMRDGGVDAGALAAWDIEVARYGAELMARRGAAVRTLQPELAAIGAQLGLGDDLLASYEPASKTDNADELRLELERRRERDIERGFTTHGPHRDELSVTCGGVDLRHYGSQGQQRLSVLGLLFAEREALGRERGCTPVMLLDDAMSELDPRRRVGLIDLVLSKGQSVITVTDADEVPTAEEWGADFVAVREGNVSACSARKVAQ